MPSCCNSSISPACGTPPQRSPALCSPARKEIPLHPRATPSTADSGGLPICKADTHTAGRETRAALDWENRNMPTGGHQQSPSRAAPEHRPRSQITNPGLTGAGRFSFQMQTQTPACLPCLPESQIKGGNEKQDKEETCSST